MVAALKRPHPPSWAQKIYASCKEVLLQGFKVLWFHEVYAQTVTVQMACHPSPALDLLKQRFFFPALGHGMAAAGMKGAPRRGMEGARWVSVEDDSSSSFFGIGDGNG